MRLNVYKFMVFQVVELSGHGFTCGAFFFSGPDMTDDNDKPHDHLTEAERKKAEAAKRLAEALQRKQQNRPQGGPHQQQGGGKPNSPGGGGQAPKLFRRGPRGG